MNSDDQKIKRISRMLELGGTMLAEHCMTCGAPKFRYQGQVICPVCDVSEEPQPPVQKPAPTPEPAVPVKKPEPVARPEPEVPESAPVRRKVSRPEPIITEMTPVEELILRKITTIGHQMQDETDPRRIEESFELIERGLSIIERLKRIE